MLQGFISICCTNGTFVPTKPAGFSICCNTCCLILKPFQKDQHFISGLAMFNLHPDQAN